MKRSYIVLLALLLVNVCVFAQFTEDINSSIVPKVRSGALDLESIRIVGQIAQYVENMKVQTDEYLVKDKWGQPLTVRFAKPQIRPIPGQWYEITGVIVFDNSRNLRLLQELSRKGPYNTPEIGETTVVEGKDEELKKAAMNSIRSAENLIDESKNFLYDLSSAESKLSDSKENYNRSEYNLAIIDAKSAEQIVSNPSFSLIFYLIILVVLAVVAVIVVVFIRSYMSKVNDNQKKMQMDFEKKFQEVIDNLRPKTVPLGDGANLQVHEPTVKNETLVVLPFRFDLQVDGKNDSINFYIGRNDADCEFTFGKNPGPELKHIKIDHPTVSRDQAKLIWDKTNKVARLINHASAQSNPTRVNGKALQAGETCDLNDGDEVMMGVVKMLFKKGIV